MIDINPGYIQNYKPGLEVELFCITYTQLFLLHHEIPGLNHGLVFVLKTLLYFNTVGS